MKKNMQIMLYNRFLECQLCKKYNLVVPLV